MHRRLPLVAFVLGLLPLISVAQDCPTTLAPADVSDIDRFGQVVAVHDGVAAVANLAGNGTSPGAVYVLELGPRAVRGRLTEPSASSNSQFGAAVALDGERVVVGAPAPGAAGRAYVFDAASGDLLHTLVPSDSATDDGFGSAVGISAGRIAVGAPTHGTGAERTGAVFLFDATSGAELGRIRPPRAPASAAFGEALALEGTRLIVGAPGDLSRRDVRSGALYVIDAAKGRVRRKVVPTSPLGSRFGSAVALDGGTALVGALLDDDRGRDAGAAYLVDADRGAISRKLTLDEGVEGDLFGTAVALKDGLAVVSALLPGRRQGAGLAYVFDARTGERRSTLPTAGRSALDDFGRSLGLDATWLVAGVPGDDDRGDSAGEIEVFRRDELPDTPIVLDPEPTVTRLRFEFTLPGLGTFVFERVVVGRIVVEAPLDCKPPKSLAVTAFDLRTAEPEPTFAPVAGVEFTVREPGVTLATPTAPLDVAPDGSLALPLTLQLVGVADYRFLGAEGVIDLADTAPFTITLTTDVDATEGGLTLSGTLSPTSGVIDMGLGAFNPTYTVSGELSAGRVFPAFVAVVPSTITSARVDLDFVAEAGDATRIGARFAATDAPELSAGRTGVFRIGAHRSDVILDAKGRSARGASPKVRLRVRRKGGVFKVALRRAELAAALAATPTDEALPNVVPWSLTLDDGWTIAGTLELSGARKIRRDASGAVTRASLRTAKPAR